RPAAAITSIDRRMHRGARCYSHSIGRGGHRSLRVNATDQVVFVLQIILVMGPLAVYFLGLGLVNSQARPSLVNARADFVLLTIAFLPIFIGPVLFLIQHNCLWIAGGVLAAVGGIFWFLLPPRQSAWVV